MDDSTAQIIESIPITFNLPMTTTSESDYTKDKLLMPIDSSILMWFDDCYLSVAMFPLRTAAEQSKQSLQQLGVRHAAKRYFSVDDEEHSAAISPLPTPDATVKQQCSDSAAPVPGHIKRRRQGPKTKTPEEEAALDTLITKLQYNVSTTGCNFSPPRDPSISKRGNLNDSCRIHVYE